MSSMTPEQRAAILAAGPNLYRKGTPPSPFNDFGIETPAGWYELVLEATKQIEAEIVALPEAERGDYYAKQVKEKFASLRFYVSKYTAVIQEIIGAAEKRSRATCQTCGASGSQRARGLWVYTACDEHAKPEKATP